MFNRKMIVVAVMAVFSGAAFGQGTATGVSSSAPLQYDTATGYKSTAGSAIIDNATATGAWSTASGHAATVTGSNSLGSADFTTVTGHSSWADAYKATVSGSGSEAHGIASVVDGADSFANGNYSVALGASSKTSISESYTVSLGVTGGLTRRLINLSNGVANSDAATVGQLNAALAGVSSADQVARDAAAAAQTTANGAEVKADTAIVSSGIALTTATTAQTTANGAMTYSTETRVMLDDFAAKTDSRFKALDTRMDSMTKEYRSGIAAAMAGTHSVMSASQAGGIGVGVATYGGQAAISMGLVRQIGLVSINASVSHSGGETGAGMGFGWKL